MPLIEDAKEMRNDGDSSVEAGVEATTGNAWEPPLPCFDNIQEDEENEAPTGVPTTGSDLPQGYTDSYLKGTGNAVSSRPSECHGPVDVDQAPTTVYWAIDVALAIMFSVLAWLCAMFVFAWKIVDTSYIFREREDPSLFDQMREEFDTDSGWPLAKAINDGKDTYRVYFFVMPFAVSFFFLCLKNFVQVKGRIVLRKPQTPNIFRKHVLFGLSVTDLVMVSMALVYSALLVWARMKRCLVRGPKKLKFLYQDSEEKIDLFSWEAAEIMALTFGVLAITFLGWFLIMPISRRSVFLEVAGVPWEVAVKYHRWLGWYTLVILLAHTFTYIAVWIKASGDPKYDPDEKLLQHMLVPGGCHDGSCDSERLRLHTEMMFGFAALLIVVIMSAFAVDYIRRRFFEVFFYSHQLFRLFVVFLCLHYSKTMLYLLPSIVILLFDKSIGYLSHLWSVKVLSHCVTDDTIELRIRKRSSSECRPGQYVFVNVPAVSVLEWHPMTVTWATTGTMALHIKSRGPGTWTQQVFDEVYTGGGRISVRLDGFYGTDHVVQYNLGSRKAVVLFAGGCGLTYPFGVALELGRAHATVPVHIFWVTRTWEEYAAFERLFLDTKSRFENISVSVWVTLSQTNEGTTMENSSKLLPCSSPYSHEPSVPLGGQEMQSNTWAAVSDILWPRYLHALLIVVAILLGALGYAQTRKNQTDSDSYTEIRAILIDRLFHIAVPVLMVSAVLYLFVATRLFFYYRRLSDFKLVHQWSGSGSSTESIQSPASLQEETTPTESSPPKVGASVIVAGVGSRPNISLVVENIWRKYPQNVAVLACGPQKMVDAVKEECRKYVWDSWVMSEEEWEW